MLVIHLEQLSLSSVLQGPVLGCACMPRVHSVDCLTRESHIAWVKLLSSVYIFSFQKQSVREPWVHTESRASHMPALCHWSCFQPQVRCSVGSFVSWLQLCLESSQVTKKGCVSPVPHSTMFRIATFASVLYRMPSCHPMNHSLPSWPCTGKCDVWCTRTLGTCMLLFLPHRC